MDCDGVDAYSSLTTVVNWSLSAKHDRLVVPVARDSCDSSGQAYDIYQTGWAAVVTWASVLLPTFEISRKQCAPLSERDSLQTFSPGE